MAGFQFTPYQPDTRSILELMTRGPAARAAALRASGEAQARAMEIGGQARAQAAQSIGQSISGSIGELMKQREEAPYRAAQIENMRAQAEDRKLAGQQRADTARTNQTIDALMKDSLTTDPTTGATTYDRGKLQQGFTQAGIGHLWPQYSELVDKSDTSVKTLKEAHKAAIKDVAQLVDASGNDATVFANELMRGVKNGLFTEAEAAPLFEAVQRDPTHVAKITSMVLGKKPELMSVNPGDVVINKDNPAAGPVFTAPASEAQRAASANLTADNARADAAATETARHNKAMEARPVAGAGSSNDVQLAIQGMKEGTLPPQMPGRASKDYTAIMAEAKRQGYDLAAAATDWNATQKHVATLNGAQQLRLNQSISALPDLLDSVDTLATKWKAGRFPLLNKANLALAKGGAFGRDAASVANQLDAQIADVVSDLGNVYMGGNSPTDHALSLASKSLSAEWDEKVLRDMVKLAKNNVTVRLNSIRNVGVQGASAGNPYAAPPPSAAPPPPAGGAPTYADYLKSRGGK